MSGIVESIHFVRESRGTAHRVDVIDVRADFGFPDDYRSRKQSNRQITLIEAEALEAASVTLGWSVPDGATLRQVVVRGLDLNSQIGHKLKIGDITLAVERYCAPCQLMNEQLGPGGRDALRWKAGVCCRVVNGGTLRVGDRVVAEHTH